MLVRGIICHTSRGGTVVFAPERGACCAVVHPVVVSIGTLTVRFTCLHARTRPTGHVAKVAIRARDVF